MKAFLLLVLVLVLIGGGLRMAGVRLPVIDYPIGSIGEGRGPEMPDIQVEAPGYAEFEAP